MKNDLLQSLTKEELIRLIEDYSKNWLAMDGVWFQSVERKRGMDEAMYHDAEAWRRFTVIEAKRIKEFLGLPEHAGLEGLAPRTATAVLRQSERGGNYFRTGQKRFNLPYKRMPRAAGKGAERHGISSLQAGRRD